MIPARDNRALIIVGWIGTALVAAAAGRFAAVNPLWDRFLVWALVTGLAGALVYVASHRADLVRAFQSPASGRLGLTTATLLGALLLLAIANYLTTSFGVRWDLTANAVYRLSPQTRSTLRRLDAPVRIRLFAGSTDLAGRRDRLEEYSKASKRITVEYVNIDEQPALARQYDIRTSGTVLIDYKARGERVIGPGEQEVTTALVHLIENRTLKAYFTLGHAERDIASTERAGYNTIAAALARSNFVVDTVNVPFGGAVPSDATLLVLAGPRTDLFDAELEILQGYMKRGGKVLLLVDPPEDLKRYITESGTALFMMDQLNAAATSGLKNLSRFVHDWGVQLGNDVVVDASGMGQFFGTDASVAIGVTYPPHPITVSLTSLTAFPIARSVMVAPDAAARQIAAQSIVETGPETWTQTDLKRLSAGAASVTRSSGDRPGPISLAVAASMPASTPAASGSVSPAAMPGDQSAETRLVVVGDSDFVANYSANVPGNEELFLNAVRWLSQQESQTTIPTRQLEDRRLDMTASGRRNLSWLALFVLPLIFVSAAVFLWTQTQDEKDRGSQRVSDV